MKTIAMVAGLCGLMLAGCGYTSKSVWRQDVKTVAVPIFDSISLRRGLEFDLTRAVATELMRRTGYTPASNRDADTILLGTITDYRTPVIVEDSRDHPYEYTIAVTMKLTWQDQRTGNVLFEDEVSETADVVVQAGGDVSSARDRAMAKLAQTVVNRLLRDW